MAHLKFRFDPKNPLLTMGDFSTIEMLQDGQVKIFRLQKLAARCMVGEDGEYLPFPRAMAILDDLPRDEMNDAIQQFGEAVKQAAVNPTSAASSPQPSEAITPTSPSQDG